jgi:hypothetical protein
LVWAQQQDQG